MIQPTRMKSALAAALALSAIAASSAAARPAVYSPPTSGSAETTSTCSKVCSAAGYSTAAHGQVGPGTASGDDFDWGDAAIGAGGAVVVLLFGAGSVRAAASRRSHAAGGVDVTAAS